MNFRFILTSLLLAPLIGLCLTGCSNRDPEDFRRDDYFGGYGSATSNKGFVPREVQAKW